MKRGIQVHAKPDPIEEVLERIRPKLESLTTRYRIPPQDADDLVQQAYLAFVHKRDDIRDVENWLVGTVRKQCLMYLRSYQRRFCHSVDAAILEILAEPQRPGQEQAEINRDLNRALARVPERCRTLLRLRYRLGYEPKEMAEHLGYRSSSIRKVTSRCLATLAREMIAVGFLKDKDHA